MRIAYIAGPYRGNSHYEVELNIRIAESVAIELWQMNFAVICPHKNTSHFDGLAPDRVWLDGDLEFIDRLDSFQDCLVMLPNWEKSEGATREREFAIARYLTIFCWPIDKQELKEFARKK
jgi:hypothetical protein